MTKLKIKKGDKVLITAGKDKGKSGKVLQVDREGNRVIVEGLNIIKKHQKPRGQNQQGGIIEKAAPIHASNVMYMHNGKPTRLGYKVIKEEKNGKMVVTKQRIAKATGDMIDQTVKEVSL